MDGVTPQKPGSPIDNLSTRGIPLDFRSPDTTLLCPIYQDPYFQKNLAESPLFEELYLIYNLYNNISMTHPRSQQK